MDCEPSYDPQSEFCEQDFYLSGRCLWLSVLKRAVEEARGVNLIVDSRNGSLERIEREQAQIQDDARRWLGEASEGLETVCEWAGVDVRKVLKEWGRKG